MKQINLLERDLNVQPFVRSPRGAPSDQYGNVLLPGRQVHEPVRKDAQTSITSDIYSHIITSAEAKAAQVLDKFSEDIHLKVTPKQGKENVF